VSYPEQIRLAQGCPVIVPGRPENDFRLTAGELDAALTPRTRIVILNYPSNPGGFTYSRRDLLQLAEVLEGRSLIVISDEMYDRLTYGRDAHTCFASLSRHAWEHTLVVNAPSKSYAMTGWRLGYAAGPEPLIKAMSRVQSQTTSGTCHFAQFGLAEALAADQKCVDEMRATFDRRRQLMYRGLCALKDVTCVEPRGAFYCFPDVSATYARLGVSDSDGFSQRALDEVHVAVVPGSAFGCDRHVRLAYATGDEDIIEGLSRLKRLLG
jgi:aspartate aminotransferase